MLATFSIQEVDATTCFRNTRYIFFIEIKKKNTQMTKVREWDCRSNDLIKLYIYKIVKSWIMSFTCYYFTVGSLTSDLSIAHHPLVGEAGPWKARSRLPQSCRTGLSILSRGLKDCPWTRLVATCNTRKWNLHTHSYSLLP